MLSYGETSKEQIFPSQFLRPPRNYLVLDVTFQAQMDAASAVFLDLFL